MACLSFIKMNQPLSLARKTTHILASKKSQTQESDMIELKLPNLGEGIESGDVLEILVSVGDSISKDDGVLELETDKATVTVPAEEGGVVKEILVNEGDSIAVGSVIFKIEGDASATTEAPTEAVETAQVAPASTTTPTNQPPAQATSPVQASQPVATAPAAPKPAVASASSMAQVPAGPAIRRFAREVGIDLREVGGTGPNGRIIREDVLRVVREGSSRSVSNGAAPVSTGPSLPLDATSDEHGPVRVEKMPKIRRTIAQKMHESWSTAPRVTNFDDADITALEELRQGSKEAYKAEGVRLTTMPFVIKAVAMALKAHPTINASIDMNSGAIIYKEYINVGIAVDTERGLVVPNLRNADKVAIPDIARQLGVMADSVRNNNFSIEDLRGGTFTISNLGAIGGTYSTPIINVPETAILLVGRSRKMPVVVGDEIKIRLMMPMSLSYDHRLIDGGTAARFLNDVIAYLETPSRLLLAL